MSDGTDKVKPMDGRPRPDPARVKEFADTARRLQRERSGAGEVVSRVLDSTPREEWPSLAERTELRNSGALEQLAARFSAVCEKDRKEALAVSALATAIAETLPPDAYPGVTLAQLRAKAGKDRPHPLRYLARYDEAFQAIEMAERALAPYPAAAYDRAVVGLVKAGTLQQVERFEESRALLAECRRVFGEHGDTTRYLYCGITEGALLYHEKAYGKAHALWTPLLPIAFQLGDLDSAARLQNNIGCADAQLGNLREANIHIAGAKAIFTDLGKPLEGTRTERAYGLLLLARGHRSDAILVLQAAREAFASAGLVEESGLCGLSIAGALLDTNQNETARELVAQILDEFRTANLDRRPLEALNVLQTSIGNEEATSHSVHNVEVLMRDLHLGSENGFAAMPA